MMSWLKIGGCLALLLAATACKQAAPPDTRAADESAIRELDAQWAKTAATGDLEGTVAYYTDDATLLPPNAPVASGKEAIRAVWTELLVPGNSVSWQASKVDVASSGDLAYLIGTYQLTTKDPQGTPEPEHGKMIEVFRKQADGKWKVVADIFNSNDPLPAHLEKKK